MPPDSVNGSWDKAPILFARALVVSFQASALRQRAFWESQVMAVAKGAGFRGRKTRRNSPLLLRPASMGTLQYHTHKTCTLPASHHYGNKQQFDPIDLENNAQNVQNYTTDLESKVLFGKQFFLSLQQVSCFLLHTSKWQPVCLSMPTETFLLRFRSITLFSKPKTMPVTAARPKATGEWLLRNEPCPHTGFTISR